MLSTGSLICIFPQSEVEHLFMFKDHLYFFLYKLFLSFADFFIGFLVFFIQKKKLYLNYFCVWYCSL